MLGQGLQKIELNSPSSSKWGFKKIFFFFLCQLTCQAADMASLCRIHIHTNAFINIFSKSTRPTDMLLHLNDTLSIEDDKL